MHATFVLDFLIEKQITEKFPYFHKWVFLICYWYFFFLQFINVWVGRAPVPGLILPFHHTDLGSSEGPGPWLPVLYLLSPFVFQVLSGCFMWELGRSLKVRKGTSDQFCFSIPVHTLSPGRLATLSCVIWVEMASRAVKRAKGLAPAVTDLCAVCALKFSTDGILVGARVSQHLPTLLPHQCGRASASALLSYLFICSFVLVCLLV